ncbi:MAG: GMC family oxidoreductase [Pseudomonadota bacterium]
MSDYDLIVVGSGFGSLFFLKRYLERSRNVRVALVEWGSDRPPTQQTLDNSNSSIPVDECHNEIGGKAWNYTIGLGGGTNCWWGQTPRFLPKDFRLKSEYGVHEDWPLSYSDIEPYYCQAEAIMNVAGSETISKLTPRSQPFPLPPHKLSTPDRIMAQKMPDQFFPVSTARASEATADRGKCCARVACSFCPVDAKFNAYNGMSDVLRDPRVELILNAQVREIEQSAGIATGVVYLQDNRATTISGDLIVLGANAIQSPAILLRSNIQHPKTGLGLCEQLAYGVEIKLDGINNFDGSTFTTGWHFGAYDGDHRREAAATLIQVENHAKFGLRTEYGRWRHSLPLILNIEDLPRDENAVKLDEGGKATVHFAGFSDYAKAGLDYSLSKLEDLFSPLPIEDIIVHGKRGTEHHLECSLRMGADPETSVVDPVGLHHSVRNLLVVGSAIFPTCPPANPSLTIAALSLRSADILTS